MLNNILDHKNFEEEEYLCTIIKNYDRNTREIRSMEKIEQEENTEYCKMFHYETDY